MILGGDHLRNFARLINPERDNLKRIKEAGGMTIVQDPTTAEVDTMPKAAIAATQVDHVIPLEDIGQFLRKLT